MMNAKEIKSWYNNLARWYDPLLDLIRYRKTIQEIIRRAPIHIPQNGKILDLGCGTGLATEVLQERFPNATITGLDYSEAMLDIYRKRFPKNRTIVGDFNNGKDFYSYPENEKIKLSSNSYGLIISTGALSVYGNLNKAIPFVYGLLKDNGIFINSGVKDNLIGQVIGKVWHFKPKGLEEVIDVSRASQFSDVEKIHIPLSLFPSNLTRYMVTARK